MLFWVKMEQVPTNKKLTYAQVVFDKRQEKEEANITRIMTDGD